MIALADTAIQQLQGSVRRGRPAWSLSLHETGDALVECLVCVIVKGVVLIAELEVR